MPYDVPPPENMPQPGYYYHFKHDPDGLVINYAYYIYGVGHHTEDDRRPEDAFMQVYRPLYEEAYAYHVTSLPGCGNRNTATALALTLITAFRRAPAPSGGRPRAAAAPGARSAAGWPDGR
jgi:hypothetical protein